MVQLRLFDWLIAKIMYAKSFEVTFAKILKRLKAINLICFYKIFLNTKSIIYEHKEIQSRKLLALSFRKNGLFHAKILMKGWLYPGIQLGILKGRGDLHKM